MIYDFGFSYSEGGRAKFWARFAEFCNAEFLCGSLLQCHFVVLLHSTALTLLFIQLPKYLLFSPQLPNTPLVT